MNLNRDLRANLPWSKLEPGDMIDVIAPGSASGRSDLRRAIEFLKECGLKPRVQSGILGGSKIFAAPDEIRLRHLVRALKSQDSKAIWCLRGGYGSLRLLSELNRLKPPAQSKIFLGYSDITTLHQFLNLFWRWPTLHTPNLDRISKQQDRRSDLEEMKALIFGRQQEVQFRNLVALNKAARKSAVIHSTVVGGNLCVLNSTLGTPWSLSAPGKILFFEDVSEKPHRISRMLTQMQLAGVFHGVRAIVFGDFVYEDPKLLRLIWSDVIAEFAASMKIPVLKGLPCGHGKRQRALPLMTRTHLSLGTRPELRLESGCQ